MIQDAPPMIAFLKHWLLSIPAFIVMGSVAGPARALFFKTIRMDKSADIAASRRRVGKAIARLRSRVAIASSLSFLLPALREKEIKIERRGSIFYPSVGQSLFLAIGHLAKDADDANLGALEDLHAQWCALIGFAPLSRSIEMARMFDDTLWLAHAKTWTEAHCAIKLDEAFESNAMLESLSALASVAYDVAGLFHANAPSQSPLFHRREAAWAIVSRIGIPCQALSPEAALWAIRKLESKATSRDKDALLKVLLARLPQSPSWQDFAMLIMEFELSKTYLDVTYSARIISAYRAIQTTFAIESSAREPDCGHSGPKRV